MSAPPPIRGTFRTDERARAAYAEAAGIYRIIPRAVCLPADVTDLVALVRWAAAERMALVPRGAGSAMGGDNVGDGVVVDLTAMAGPAVTVAADARRARMRAGASLGELEAAAASRRLRLPPDPASGRWATAGGAISTNAAGARSVRYGSVRPWVAAIEMVTAGGEVVRLRRAGPERAAGPPGRAGGTPGAPALPGVLRAIEAAAPLIGARYPKVRKNAFGYALHEYLRTGDLLDLIVGAEGTLGIVTEVEWRLDPVPACRAGLRLLLDDYEVLPALAGSLLALEASAIELLDRTFLDVVRRGGGELPLPDAEAVVLVELESDDPERLRGAVEAAVRAARPVAFGVDATLSPAATEQLWRLRHAASPILAGLPPERRSLQVIEDGCVPVERLGQYVAAIRRAAEAQGIPVVLFGHAGDGNVHVNVLPDVTSAGWEVRVRSLFDEVSDAAIRLGGVPSGEHGAGRLRAPLLERVYGPEIVALFRKLKDAFDPPGILNPGVILPSGQPPLWSLKVGAGAAQLPADIARGLREIERTGGYATSRLRLADRP
ncbi:MAG TPA: FAD-binding oxidoreductase [Gemmatimonadales bacterium]|nr:FAD-binding oxidoreductase [Gemmatimonadales bacterium]